VIQRFFFILFICLALGGCGGKPKLLGGPEVQVLDRTTLPLPGVDADGFRLGVMDKLTIELVGMEDMQREVQIDASGNVSFPMAGQVHAAGKTPGDLARELEQRLRQSFVRDRST
jgi:polysaccharide biosynthesis/export protein